MTAATKNRNTPSRLALRRGGLVAAAVHCFAGAIAVRNAGGYVAPASTATGLVALGVFQAEYDNTNGVNGALTAEYERGVFRFDNSTTTDEITSADIGKVCYLVDDQTVAKTSDESARSVAGLVDDVDDLGVWVLIDPTSGALA